MYLAHFRLERLPFALNPDPSFHVELTGFEDAFAAVRRALEDGEGFVKLVAAVGAGKTMLCRELVSRLSGTFEIAYVPDPELSPRELLAELLHELGLEAPLRANQAELRRRLVEFALARFEQGRKLVLLIDEAQAMPAGTLESLRPLSNIEPVSHPLLQIVLFGQPELDARLARSGLRQRFTTCLSLAPLAPDEVGAYLEQRLLAAGVWSPELFSEPARALVARSSRGIPRLVNVLAHKALVASCAEGCDRVLRRHALIAIADTLDARAGPALGLRRIFGRGMREA